MHKIKENTTLVPITELRIKPKEILKEIEKNRVILEMHHKPVAVLLSLKSYELYEKFVDWAEDEYFSQIAKERMAKKGPWVPHTEVKKSI